MVSPFPFDLSLFMFLLFLRGDSLGYCAKIWYLYTPNNKACPIRKSDCENRMNEQIAPIGIFDSGYGGLTILREIRKLMPQYDYLYLGDNARSPYGSRSFEIVYKFTLQAVERLFEMGCPLVILACNTASAKALRYHPAARFASNERSLAPGVGDYSPHGGGCRYDHLE